MLATNPCLPQVEHIKSGTARDFFEVNLNVQRGAVPERNGALRTQARKIASGFDEKQQRIAWRVFVGISGAIKKRKEKKQGSRPHTGERNPRSQSRLNLENSLTAACASPVSSWPLSSISWLPSLASASTSSEPELSWPSSQVSTVAPAPSGAPLPGSARSHLRPALPRS